MKNDPEKFSVCKKDICVNVEGEAASFLSALFSIGAAVSIGVTIAAGIKKLLN